MRVFSLSGRCLGRPAGFVTDGRQRYAAHEVPDWVQRLPFPELEEVDRKLAGLGRGAGALRLGAGEVLDAFVTAGGHHELGFSSLGAYATCGAGTSASTRGGSAPRRPRATSTGASGAVMCRC